ncbi:energy-coupling factor transporter ATPase [Gracilibacillus sp. YIM 98692]|uniref:energy-coupling factor transporter ATPase n=1 Tax=Gracilibacillus sp. YIM 98692 TaxID=2663532 RepID=UPI003204A119
MSGIEFHNVFFQYDEIDSWMLNNINLKINENDTVALIGHNGSGKSTIAKLMNGLITPTSGSIYVGGQKVSKKNIWDVRKSVGMVFQNPENQFVGTTVKDDVAFGMENRGVPREEMLVRIQQSLDVVDMQGYDDHEPHHLSGGQKQRVAIASVLAIHPSIIVLDEATSMLDPLGRQKILKTLQHLKKKYNMTMIMITHDLYEAMLADRIIVMNQGKVYLDTSPQKLFSYRDELEGIGLTIPFTVQLTDALMTYGYDFRYYPINIEELIEELWKYNSIK